MLYFNFGPRVVEALLGRCCFPAGQMFLRSTNTLVDRMQPASRTRGQYPPGPPCGPVKDSTGSMETSLIRVGLERAVNPLHPLKAITNVYAKVAGFIKGLLPSFDGWDGCPAMA